MGEEHGPWIPFFGTLLLFVFVDIKSKIPPPSGQQVGEKKKPSFTSILVPFPKLACNVNALYDRLVFLNFVLYFSYHIYFL